MKKIPLTKGFFATVDDEDFEEVSQHSWHYEHGYSRSKISINGKIVRMYMHRFILKATDGVFIDHVDGDRLNNLRNNLRLCSNKQNVRSQRKNPLRGVTSKYKGVHFSKSRKLYCASIGVDGRVINLGRYINECEAAKAYNEAAKKYFGEFAVLNVVG